MRTSKWTHTFLVSAFITVLAGPNFVLAASASAPQRTELTPQLVPQWLLVAGSSVTVDSAKGHAEGKPYNLLRWLSVQAKKGSRFGDPKIPVYDRRLHFGGWVNEDAPKDCYDTRAEALMRDADSSIPVVYNREKPCQVQKALWHDPYTGRVFKTAASIQIDHVVALKHAYYTGAWRWTRPQRCHYANYMGNAYHLLSVHAHENMSKSAGDPSEYLPPNKKFICQYVKIWLKIKAIWDLEVTRQELDGIRRAMALGRCDPNDIVISEDELREQRIRARSVSVACERQKSFTSDPEDFKSNLKWMWDGQNFVVPKPGTESQYVE